MTNLFSRFKRAVGIAGEPAAASSAPPPTAAPVAAKDDNADAARVLDRITQICREISKGNFEARLVNITESGQIADAQHAVNDMIDRCDAFMREASAAMEAVRNHNYYRRILRELEQRPDEQRRVEGFAVHLAVDAAVPVDNRRLQQVVEPRGRGFVAEAELGGQALDVARLGGEKQPVGRG